MVSDYRAVHDLTRGVPETGFPERHVVFNLTTGTPDLVDQCRQEFERRGLTYVDGAVSGHPQDIATPASQLIVAGDEATWQRIGPRSSCSPTVRFRGNGRVRVELRARRP